jgi:hypothetical protein
MELFLQSQSTDRLSITTRHKRLWKHSQCSFIRTLWSSVLLEKLISAGQEVPCPFWNPKVHYHVYKNLPLNCTPTKDFIGQNIKLHRVQPIFGLLIFAKCKEIIIIPSIMNRSWCKEPNFLLIFLCYKISFCCEAYGDEGRSYYN